MGVCVTRYRARRVFLLFVGILALTALYAIQDSVQLRTNTIPAEVKVLKAAESAGEAMVGELSVTMRGLGFRFREHLKGSKRGKNTGTLFNKDKEQVEIKDDDEMVVDNVVDETMISGAEVVSTSKASLTGRESVHNQQLDLERPLGTKPRRRSLVLFGFDRSGTTFTTQVFNHDPNVFTIYEPLWVAKKWWQYNNFPNISYNEATLDIVNGILSCGFNSSDVRRRYVSSIPDNKATLRLASKALMSHPLCEDPNNVRSCGELTAEKLSDVCWRYRYSVTKITPARFNFSTDMSALVEILKNPEVDARIVQLVRDPRPSFDSRMRAGWVPKLERGEELLAKWCINSCTNLYNSITLFTNGPEWVRERYKLVRYQDMMRNPERVFQEIYEFAGFEMTDTVREWIRLATDPTPEQYQAHYRKVTSYVLNSKENIDKWMTRSPPLQVKIIEENCQQVMKLLGYENIYYNRSQPV